MIRPSAPSTTSKRCGRPSHDAVPAPEFENLQTVPSEFQPSHRVVHQVHPLHGILNVRHKAAVWSGVVMPCYHFTLPQTSLLNHIKLLLAAPSGYDIDSQGGTHLYSGKSSCSRGPVNQSNFAGLHISTL